MRDSTMTFRFNCLFEGKKTKSKQHQFGNVQEQHKFVCLSLHTFRVHARLTICNSFAASKKKKKYRHRKIFTTTNVREKRYCREECNFFRVESIRKRKKEKERELSMQTLVALKNT